jgi:hypothetical protein
MEPVPGPENFRIFPVSSGHIPVLSGRKRLEVARIIHDLPARSTAFVFHLFPGLSCRKRWFFLSFPAVPGVRIIVLDIYSINFLI